MNENLPKRRLSLPAALMFLAALVLIGFMLATVDTLFTLYEVL